MTKKPRLKSPAAAVAVPQSREMAADAIAEIGRISRNLTRLEADMNDELAQVKARHEKNAEPERLQLLALTQGVQTWAEANRADLTQGGKVKTAALTTGEVLWRNRPASVRVTGADSVIAELRRLRLRRFIRVKLEVNKEAILNEPDAVKDVAGISISKGEDFVVVPFETELEVV
jgi:phage host-nuclease inhibitor protein Gam